LLRRVRDDALMPLPHVIAREPLSDAGHGPFYQARRRSCANWRGVGPVSPGAKRHARSQFRAQPCNEIGRRGIQVNVVGRGRARSGPVHPIPTVAVCRHTVTNIQGVDREAHPKGES
jgi:hypothetical protein